MSKLTEFVKQNGIKLILWDIDGTIIDFEQSQRFAIRALFEKFGLGQCDDAMLEVYDKINKKYWHLLELGKLSKPYVLRGRFVEFFEQFGLDTGIVDEFNRAYQLALGDYVCCFPGVLETLDYFKSHAVPQFAVTNGTLVAQRKKLSVSGLEKIFDEVFISEVVGFEKPAKEFFEPITEKVNVLFSKIEPDEILIVGDSMTSDIQFGNNVGIKTCLFGSAALKDSRLRVDLNIHNYDD